MDYDKPFALIAEPDELEDLSRKLVRIGLDNAFGYISPSELKETSDLSFNNEAPIDKEEVKEKVVNQNAQIIDVRGASEYKKGHIDGAVNLFVGKLNENLDQVSKDRPVIVHCLSGSRSAIAYSLLKANGFENVYNYSGGWQDWQQH
jgi:hydroxyacylglutathione hydrolase